MEKKYFPEKLDAERVYIKKHTLELAEIQFQTVNENREYLQEFLPWVPHVQKVEDSANYIQSTFEDWDAFHIFDYGIYLKSSNKYIGNLGFHSIRWVSRVAEFGYWLDKNFQGNGYVSEALSLLEKHAFTVGVHRLEITCIPSNFRSANIAKRCGYQFEGSLRENILLHGKFYDRMVFGKLETD